MIQEGLLELLWLVALCMGFVFPAYLVRGIRTSDEEKAEHCIIICRISFGIIVAAILFSISSIVF